MERFVKLSLLLIPVLLLSFFLPNQGLSLETFATALETWEECPDGVAEENPSGDLTELSDEEIGNICLEDYLAWKLNRGFALLADWYDAPYEGEIRGGKEVRINSIKLKIRARGCTRCSGSCSPKNIYTKFYSRTNEWNYIIDDSHTFGGVMEWYNFSLDLIEPSPNGNYSVKIENAEVSGCLRIDYVGLEITYYLLGETRIWNSLEIDPRSIPKYSSFNAIGNIVCTGGDCGNVYAYLKYSDSEYGEYQNIPSSGIPMYTLNSNPYSCGNMKHLDTCNPYWVVTGTKWGNQGYHIKMVSSSNSVHNETDPILVSINPGVLYLSGSIGSSNINLTENTLLTGTVTCRIDIAPCGNVKILAEYSKNSVGFEVLGDSGNLSTTNTNPGDCGYMNPGDYCSNSWYVTGNEPGYYYIRITAYSNDTDVENRTSFLSLIVNPEQTVGVLSITDVGVNPNIINVSEGSTLSGTVSCSREYCGGVLVYAKSGGQKITNDGLGTGDENPKTCSNMQEGSSCSVSWDITGNEAGIYPLEILADSDQEGVENKTSTVVYLDVRNPVGNLYFPFEPDFGPETMDISETASLSAVIECDSSYCGRATSLVRYDNTNLSSSGNLTTQYQNPQTCEVYPCDFFWNINGSRSGGYTITLLVTSNESSDTLSRSYSLTVLDPEKPSLSVSLGDLLDQHELGKTFVLKGMVSCDNGNCGEVNVYAKYKENEGDPWTHLTQTTPLSTPENPKTINLNSGESEWVEWTVNSSVIGNYSLGISADASDPNVIDSGTAAKGIEIFKAANIGIDIQSPARGKTLARGDEFLVKVKVTDSGYPLLGGFVTASSEGFFPPVQLNESGDGIYSETISVGDTISKGSYIITMFVKRDSQIWTETTNVYVNPELDVSLETDKNDYEILDKVTLQGQVLKNGKPVQASIKLKFVCPSRSFMEITLDTDSSGNYLYEYLISMATPAEVCRFELNTKDSEGNYNFTSKDVRIFPSEKEVYRIDFLSPGPGSKYKKGDSVKIRTKISYGDDPLGEAEVLCINPMFEESIELSGVGDGMYDGDYSIDKEAPLGLWILTCVAKTPDEYFGRKSVNVYITPLELKLTRISPSQTNFQPGDVVNILLKLTYPDNKPLENATVYLKIGNQIIYLNETSESGIYEVDYNLEDQGVFTFDVHAEDQFGNERLFPGEIILTAGFAPFNLLWFVLPFVIAVMLLAGVVWKRGRKEVIIKEEPAKPRVDRKTEVKNKIAELERKINNIEKAKEEVEKEYYERKIDEKTFNRMVQNYEQEKIRLNVERDDLKKELEKL